MNRENDMSMRNEGEIKDIAEKRVKGEITSEEAQRGLEERGLEHRETWKDFVGFVAWGIFCFLPGFAEHQGLEVLSFFAQLPAIEFPMVVIYLSLVLFITMILLAVSQYYYNSKKGGCGHEDHTVILLKTGPYGIVRHPGVVSWTFCFVAVTIIISNHVSFTILSVAGNIVLIVFCYWSCLVEEKELDLKKWGDEYREYMKEVPRWNFIKGIWNLKRKQ